MTESLRIANCSGFYGDRIAAAKEMVEDGPIDFLTGDYLAELTMMILLKDKTRKEDLGYARTFLRQLGEVAETCAKKGIKIVVNAGGLNPSGLAQASENIYSELGLQARVAYTTGDDLLPRLDELQDRGEALAHLDKGIPLSELGSPVLSANAYLGAFGIVEALNQGADIVICPRVTDAAVTLGPAAWKFGWARDDWDQLAAGVVAGHIIECGSQCTGGNYAFYNEVPDLSHPGFPIAEMYADGSFVVTKHEGTGGLVSVGTVTAQLLYEIGSTRYANPDVISRFDTIQLEQEGPDRVLVSGIRGEPAPPTTKVCMNYEGGYKNSTTFAMTGPDVEAKARVAENAFWGYAGGKDQFIETRSTLAHGGPAETEAFGLLTLGARAAEEGPVGRKFWNAGVEMGLANYPGFKTVSSSRGANQITVYWPALVSSDVIDERVVFDGKETPVAPPQTAPITDDIPVPSAPAGKVPSGPTRNVPLGTVAGARSGDKGGNANVGFWTRSDEAYLWLEQFLTADKLREMYPEAAQMKVERFELPNILSLNFVVHGLLGDGVSASLRTDAQAKVLCEELRRVVVPIPESLLG
ncbi:MAG: Protein of unknown function (DUF1446) [Chloroflexi bacterium]|nr:MAG: Protein of unknown function (DUF1446) [Chloroflexota bacterium]